MEKMEVATEMPMIRPMKPMNITRPMAREIMRGSERSSTWAAIMVLWGGGERGKWVSEAWLGRKRELERDRKSVV